MKYVLQALIIGFLLSACNSSGDQGPVTKGSSIPKEKLEFAEKFSISSINDFTLLTVYSPWQHASARSFQYLLGEKKDEVPDSLREIEFIKTPVQKVVIMSTTYISFIDTLNELQSIKGISGSHFVYNADLRERISKGLVREVGFDQNLNYEVLVELDPDVVFIFGVQSGVVQIINKFKEIGIPVVLCADYLEPTPLGRVEWIKFFSAFYEKRTRAEKIYSSISENYKLLKASVDTATDLPEVMLGLPWKDSWYVAGGESFAAKLIHDAGGSYIYSDFQNTEAKPVDIEAVFSRSLEADFWINPGVAKSLKEISQHDARFELLSAYKNQKIFANNKRISPGGGNDYWESGILNPDLILKDLITIFHDSAENDSKLVYYFRLN